MSKLANTGIATGKPHESCIKGLFIRDMPLEDLMALLEGLDDKDDDRNVIWRIYDVALCDKNGRRFEDFPQPEDASKMTLAQIHGFQRAFKEFFESLGKSLSTGSK